MFCSSASQDASSAEALGKGEGPNLYLDVSLPSVSLLCVFIFHLQKALREDTIGLCVNVYVCGERERARDDLVTSFQ